MSDIPSSAGERGIPLVGTTPVIPVHDNENPPRPSATQTRKLVRNVSCNGCFDLNYDMFWPSTGFKYPPGGDANMRYRITSPERVSAAAEGGCRLCHILHQGIDYARGELGSCTTDRSVKVGGDVKSDGESEDTDDEDIKNSAEDIDEVTGFNKIVSRRLKSTFHRSERKRECNIFLALRVNRHLTINRTPINEEQSYWAFWEWNYWGQLQLYTEIGMCVQNIGIIHNLIIQRRNFPPGCTPIHPAFGHVGRVPSSLDLDHCTYFVQKCLDNCQSRHESCLAPSTVLPKRLVYVTDQTVKLVETGSLPYSPYLTLSHCWGQNAKMMKTTKHNLDQMKAKIDWEELPAVFRDALMLTKSLGQQWIWIDALCIIQDDERDWQQQSSEMAAVYSNSFLNIAATSSPDSHRGFFSERNTFALPPTHAHEIPVEPWKLEDVSATTESGLLARFAHLPCHKITVGHARSFTTSTKIAPLLQRAWAFQELLLAPRNLHIASSEMIWECNTLLDCECGEIAYDTGNGKEVKVRFSNACQGRMSKEEVLELWYNIISLYSELKLTKPSDRPHALAGIASRFSQILKSEYIAGLWAIDIPKGLMWSPRRFIAAKDPSIGPTWSWISRYEPENYTALINNGRIKPDHRLQVHLSETKCEYADVDCFGRVPHGELVISGFVFHAKLENHGHFKGRPLSGVWEHTTVVIGDSEGVWRRDCRDRDGNEEELTDALCLLAGTRPTSPKWISGLILQPDSDAKETVYRRIGIVGWDLEEVRDRGMFEHGEVKKLTIV